jgi:hypothetical protein
MTKQRDAVLAAIRDCHADGVPATEAEIVRRTGMRPMAVKAHCEHMGRVKPVALVPGVGHPVTIPVRRSQVTVQRGESKPRTVEVEARRVSDAVMEGMRVAGYEVTCVEVMGSGNGAHKDG